jgi:hypothetical protein
VWCQKWPVIGERVPIFDERSRLEVTMVYMFELRSMAVVNRKEEYLVVFNYYAYIPTCADCTLQKAVGYEL